MANQTSNQQITVVGTKKNLRSILMREDVTRSLAAIADRCMNAERIQEQALLAVHEQPQLLQCTPASFIAALRYVAQIGLPFCGPGALVHLIPFGRQVNTIINYKGECSLARRSGAVKAIWARLVYEKDEFKVMYGSTEKIIHKPYIGIDRGKIIAVYAIAQLKDGIHQFEVMSIDEVETIRKHSKMSNAGPWKTHYSEMVKKTSIRRLVKFLPCASDIMPMAEVAENSAMTEDHPPKPVEAQDVINDNVDFETSEMIVEQPEAADIEEAKKPESEHFGPESESKDSLDAQKAKLVDEICKTLGQLHAGDSVEAQAARLKTLNYIYGKTQIDQIAKMPVLILEAGLHHLEGMVKSKADSDL